AREIVAIADDRRAPFQARHDHRLTVVDAVRGEQEPGGGPGKPVRRAADRIDQPVLQRLAQQPPDGSRAGLAGQQHVLLPGSQAFGEPLGVRGAPAAVDALQDDEATAGQARLTGSGGGSRPRTTLSIRRVAPAKAETASSTCGSGKGTSNGTISSVSGNARTTQS